MQVCSGAGKCGGERIQCSSASGFRTAGVVGGWWLAGGFMSPAGDTNSPILLINIYQSVYCQELLSLQAAVDGIDSCEKLFLIGIWVFEVSGQNKMLSRRLND